MLRENCSYNSERDLQAVDQTGFLDLALAHSSGSVPAVLEVDTVNFNEIDDPNSIVARPADNFEAMQTGKALLSRVKVKKDAPSE